MVASLAAPRRVVVTGLGLICPLGLTPESLWDGLCQGRSGVGPLQRFSPQFLPTPYAAEAHAFTGDIQDFGTLEKSLQRTIRKGLKLMCREIEMGVAAAQRALQHAGLETGRFEPDRTGVVYGTDHFLSGPEEFTQGVRKCVVDGRFDFSLWGEQGLPEVQPLWLLKYLPNMPASHIAIYNDLRGPNNSLTMREASSNLAIGEAFATIRRGAADTMIAGATGTRIHPVRTLHVVLQEEVATNGVAPERLSRPFDRNRTGMVLGEGAGALVLEELSVATARGATIWGEVLGHGSSTVMSRQGLADRSAALANAARAALRAAGLSPDQVGHVHAHGLSTRTADEEETQALRAVFGDRPVPVTAAKSYFGNLGAASGLIECVASLLALRHERLFPILNYETPDPRCNIAVVRANDQPPGETFLNLNVSPQGQASAVIFRRFA